VEPTTTTALELLRRLPEGNAHDQITHDYETRPIVDFLLRQPSARITPDLQLGFLVKTASQKMARRRLGVILLKPTRPAPEDDALWGIWFRSLFAEVDPGFARELSVLNTPVNLEMLHSSDCQVTIARHQRRWEAGSVRLREPDL
jgi:hypothetical protein